MGENGGKSYPFYEERYFIFGGQGIAVIKNENLVNRLIPKTPIKLLKRKFSVRIGKNPFLEYENETTPFPKFR